jgi:hypothetical protein
MKALAEPMFALGFHFLAGVARWWTHLFAGAFILLLSLFPLRQQVLVEAAPSQDVVFDLLGDVRGYNLVGMLQQSAEEPEAVKGGVFACPDGVRWRQTHDAVEIQGLQACEKGLPRVPHRRNEPFPVAGRCARRDRFVVCML